MRWIIINCPKLHFSQQSSRAVRYYLCLKMENGISFLRVGCLDQKDPQSSREQEKSGGVGWGQDCSWQRGLWLSLLPMPDLLWHVMCQGTAACHSIAPAWLAGLQPIVWAALVFPYSCWGRAAHTSFPCSQSTRAQLCASANSSAVFVADCSHRVIATSEIHIFPLTFPILKKLCKYCVVVN